VVVDVITNPRITLFLAAARQLAMQIFEQRTGVTPEEAVVQRAVAAALGE
jgi:shikimate dehydrogenase